MLTSSVAVASSHSKADHEIPASLAGSGELMVKAGIGSEFGFGRRGGYSRARRYESRLEDVERVMLTANGRAALALAVRYASGIRKRAADTVLLPSYLCQSMIQPFLEIGMRVRFYRVSADLSIDADDVCKEVDNRTLAILVMHYFGFLQTSNVTDTLARRFPTVTIIEDRTHLLLGDLNNGAITHDSAIAVYSPRKWGPFPDLGIVIWPRDGGNESIPVEGGYDLPFGFWRLMGLVLRGAFFACPKEVLRRLSLWPFQKADAVLDDRVRIRHASPISRWLWRRWDWKAAWLIRRSNYQYLLENWPSKELIPLIKTLEPSVCPLGFPIRALERDGVKQYLISRGIYPPIHWLRPPQVSSVEFPEAAALSSQELTIPIDQRYGAQHMDRILEAVCHV